VLLFTLLLAASLGLVLFEKWGFAISETVALILAAGAFVSSFYHFHT
jgi:hypothetical protein